MAEDGKVYEKESWDKYSKQFRSENFQSPWTKKKISKKVYFSASIKQVIQQAVKDGKVPDEWIGDWNRKLQYETKFLYLKEESLTKPEALMMLSDLYYLGEVGVTAKDFEQAFLSYKLGWTKWKLPIFFLKMVLISPLRTKHTQIDVICAWSSLINEADKWKRKYVKSNTISSSSLVAEPPASEAVSGDQPASNGNGSHQAETERPPAEERSSNASYFFTDATGLAYFTVSTIIPKLKLDSLNIVYNITVLSKKKYTNTKSYKLIEDSLSATDKSMALECATKLANFINENNEGYISTEESDSESENYSE